MAFQSAASEADSLAKAASQADKLDDHRISKRHLKQKIVDKIEKKLAKKVDKIEKKLAKKDKSEYVRPAIHYETVCHNHPKEVCRQVPHEVCADEPRETCRDVPREDCRTENEEVCHDVNKEVCVDKEHCKEFIKWICSGSATKDMGSNNAASFSRFLVNE